MEIKLTFLGTSDSIPSVKRNHTSILLTYKNENILLDCGEGTQRQFRKAHLSMQKITRILLTHSHGDHSLGLPGLLQSLAMGGNKKEVTIYGPKGTKAFVQNVLRAFPFHREYNLKVEEVTGKFLDLKEFYLEAKSMNHGIPVNAYSFVKKGVLRIDKKKLKKSGLPESELLQKLKQGKNITYKGKKYLAKNLTFKDEAKKVSFVFDTKLNANIVPFVKDSNLLVCEATFGEDMEELAKDHGHLTSKQTGEIAKKAKVKKLLISHISQRFEKNLNEIVEQVKKKFKNASLVKDFDVVEI